MFDIIIKNGTIVDGTGNPRYNGDIAVKDGKIVKIGTFEGDAREIISAAGLIAAPGFIDGHTHSDKSLFKGSDSYNYLEQGVVTQIAGQCGSSPAPLNEDDKIGGDLNLSPEEEELVREICATPESFMKHSSTVSCGTNMALLLGHSALRNHAMGYSDAKPSDVQMNVMKENVINAMESGFLGYSSGLGYAPSVYADTDELIELARAMSPYGGVYASHIRSEGDKGGEAVAEAIRVGEEGGVPVIISHLKVVGKKNEGRSVRYLQMIDDANARGVTVYADQYPFTASSSPLSSQIPPKYLVGGMEKLLERLADKETRKCMLESIYKESDEFESAIYTAGFEGIMVVGAPKTPAYVGKTIAQLAKEYDKEPMDMYCDLLIENNASGAGIYFSQIESDMRRIIAHPRVFGGSDWSDFRSRIDPEHVAGSHPRGTATFVRRLEIIRNENLRTLEDSVRSVTSLPAIAAGLKGQGILAEGSDANITIFDYQGLKANADFLHPFRRNDGISMVIVNGRIAVKDGRATGVRAGKMLKRSR